MSIDTILDIAARLGVSVIWKPEALKNCRQLQKRMEQHFPKFLRKRTTSRGQLCVESFSHRVKFTSLCSYTSFPPRVVCVDGNKVRKNCNKNGDSYAGISCCFFGGVLLCANFYNQIRTKFSDQLRFPGNCPPTPPLSHHFALSEK